jgi:integrase
VRARIVRAYLRWAGLPVPEALHATARGRQVPAAWRDALTAWRAYQLAAGYPETTLTTRRHHLEQLATVGGHLDPWAVTRADLLAWLGNHPGWSPETRYGHRVTLRVFYRWAAEEGHIPTDPAARLPTVRRPAPQARPLPVAHLYAALADADERLGLMLGLAAGYGLRRGEIAAVHARDVIDGTDGAPVLLVQGKGRKVRRVPITPTLARVIRDRGGYLFPGADGGHLSARWVGRLLSRALPQGWTAHTARHLFATTAYHLDRDLFTVQDLLGHASANTTRTYVALDEHAKRGTVLGVADALHLTSESSSTPRPRTVHATATTRVTRHLTRH